MDIFDADHYPKINARKMPYMFDAGHFTTYGAEEEVKQILPVLIKQKVL
ncbi:hypothetical protein ABDD95_14885 [Mucilaginibacter sp. PAMB04274]